MNMLLQSTHLQQLQGSRAIYAFSLLLHCSAGPKDDMDCTAKLTQAYQAPPKPEPRR